jgi:DNA protecting protein DprA
MPKVSDAVAYYRMSNDRQEHSIADQRAEVVAYAAKHGYRIIREYIDEAISGDDTEKRVEFQRMLHDAKACGDFEVILCWDQDRFGRFDQLEAGFWIKPLRDAGVRLETVGQGRIDWEDFAGRIIYAVQQEGKHAFLRDLSRNVTRSMLAKAKQGLWLGGPPPYGYVTRDGRLALGDPAEVDVVRWIFETYATTSVSLGDLTRQLNERHVPGPGGGMWHKTSTYKILTSPVYCGDTVWNRRHGGKYHEVAGGEIRATPGKKRQVRWRNPAEDVLVVPDTHEPLVGRDTFARVRQKLKTQQGNRCPRQGNAKFVFTGLVFCMHCGSPMHGCTNVQPQRNKKGEVVRPKCYPYRRYICGRYNAFGRAGCTCNTITERQLLNAVVRRIQQDFLAPENLQKLREEMARQLAGRSGADPGQAKRLRAKVAELDRQIGQGAEKLLTAPADLMELLVGKLREWRQQRDQAQAELDAAEAQARRPAPAPEATIDRALGYLQSLHERLGQADPALLRETVREAVARIECWFTHIPLGKKGRQRSVLERGLIHVRPDVVIVRDVPGGLARGIDGAAHRGALEAGGRTLAVLAGGLSRIYPPEHADLAREVEASGALLSEAAMRQDPMAGMFPARNRLISGLSRGVVIIEAAERSGALITAEHAAEQGRSVFAVPGPVDSEASSGTLRLIRDGATLVRSAEDILEDLDGVAAAAAAAPKPPTPVPPGLDATQQRLWEFLADRPRHVDEMAQQLGLAVPQITGALMMLEMKKVVRRLPGNQYERR